MLQDELATRVNVKETLALWLSKRVTKDSIIVFHFAGHAPADSRTGEILLMPYHTTPQSSLSPLILLRFLQNRLFTLGLDWQLPSSKHRWPWTHGEPYNQLHPSDRKLLTL